MIKAKTERREKNEACRTMKQRSTVVFYNIIFVSNIIPNPHKQRKRKKRKLFLVRSINSRCPY